MQLFIACQFFFNTDSSRFPSNDLNIILLNCFTKLIDFKKRFLFGHMSKSSDHSNESFIQTEQNETFILTIQTTGHMARKNVFLCFNLKNFNYSCCPYVFPSCFVAFCMQSHSHQQITKQSVHYCFWAQVSYHTSLLVINVKSVKLFQCVVDKSEITEFSVKIQLSAMVCYETQNTVPNITLMCNIVNIPNYNQLIDRFQ